MHLYPRAEARSAGKTKFEGSGESRMSASQDKKRRSDERTLGTERRQVASQKEAKERKQSKIKWTVGTVIVVLLVVAILLGNSSLFYTARPALQVGDVKYSTAEVNYAYRTAYLSFCNQYSSILSSIGFDTSKPLDEQKCTISQTDKFAAEPNTKAGVRGEDFTSPWSLTASYAPSKTNRILTIIQVEADGNRIVDIKHADSNSFQCGDWKIEAELNTKRPANLYIRNSKTQATFSYGKEKPVINGQVYESKDKNSSILYDSFDGKWEVQEMKDRPAQATGKIK